MKGKNKFVLLSLIAMSLLIASQNVFAQKTGTLQGQVLDESGAGVEWAIVDVGLDSQKFESKPDKDGKFRLSLPEGTYNVIVRCDGFKPSRKRQVKIIAEKTAEISITLIIGATYEHPGITQTGTLKGQILDLQDKGVRDAKITVELNSYTFETKSDKEGKYALSLPEGTHNVFVRAEGFINYKMTGIDILAEKTTEISMYLTVRPPPHPEVPIDPEKKTKKDPDKP